MIWKTAAFLLVASAVACGEKLRYDGYQVYRLLPGSQHQLSLISNLAARHEDIQFWRPAVVVNRTADVMVSPESQLDFLRTITVHGIKAAVYVDDVQRLIDNERSALKVRASFGWDDYYNLEEIHAWLYSLPELYPDVVTTVVGGSSYEGREIRGVRIAFSEENPAIVVEAGIHANEWIGPATATWIINEILTTNDSSVSSVVRQFNYYIFPNLNPDGYSYTWTTDRMWRRTRTPYSECPGADPNRNWDFHWLEEGASPNQCSDSYAGPAPFSETETRTFSEFLTGLGDELQVYLSFHSYGQMLMFPYGLQDLFAPNHEELLGIATRSAEALAARYGTQYSVGRIVDTIYAASGSSIDWVMDVLNKRYSFVWELRDTGAYGMLLPAEQIMPNSQETFDSLLSILRDVLTNTRAHGKPLH